MQCKRILRRVVCHKYTSDSVLVIAMMLTMVLAMVMVMVMVMTMELHKIRNTQQRSRGAQKLQ